MGVEPSSSSRHALPVVAECDDEPAKPAPGRTVGKGSAAPSGSPPPASPEPNAHKSVGGPSRVPSAPSYDPSKWDKVHVAALEKKLGPLVSPLTPNCYAYAVNAATFDGPGNSLGWNKNQLLPPRDLQDVQSAVIAGAKFDGLEFVGKNRPPPKPGTYLIAFYKCPRVDDSDAGAANFHFVRQDSDGGWSHKPGSLPPRRTDWFGRKITDPATADLRLSSGRKYEFVGFFRVPERGLKPEDGVTKDRPIPAGLRPHKEGNPVGKDRMLIAGYKSNKNSFMYIQQTSDGKWHSDLNTTKDFKGNEIKDPRTAEFSNNLIRYEFVGYYTAPNGRVDGVTD